MMTYPSIGSRVPMRTLCIHCRASSFVSPPRIYTSVAHAYIPAQYYHATSQVWSGHSRWSKIKHDKAKEDGRTTAVRARFSHDIVTLIKTFGPDQASNPRLADLLAKAKKAGFPKASIEAAIARGQGKSVTGRPLEFLAVEAIMPGNIGIIIEYETDNKLGHTPMIKHAIKHIGGAPSPSTFLFTRKGRVMFDRGERSFDDVFERALEASALDVVEEADGRITVFAEPTQTTAVAEALVESLGIEPDEVESEMVWHANPDTESPMQESAAASQLIRLMDALDELDVGVQKVFVNATQGSVDDDVWSDLQTRLG